MLAQSPPEQSLAPGEFSSIGKPPKRRLRALITILLLSIALAAAGAVLTLSLIRLDEANHRIDEQNRQIEEQKDLIEQKQTFGAAMDELLSVAKGFEGLPISTIVPLGDYDELAHKAWFHRWSPVSLQADIDAAHTAADDLRQLVSSAELETGTNLTGTVYEAIIDQLGRGFVASSLSDADSICQSDVLACVAWDDPYTVHFDAASDSEPHMTDWIRTGVAYHEFAHVMQATNPEQTEPALAAFGGDLETMADCFALTFLDGWSLDHVVWDGPYFYWEVSVGYGYTCDEAQRQTVRDWYEQVAFRLRPISQEG